MNIDEKWMKIAIEEALVAKNEGEVPVGAILVKNQIIIAKGHNQNILCSDASAHAEIQTIRAAGKKLKNYRLVGTTLYVTLLPCSMCIGAIRHARIERLVFGAKDNKINSKIMDNYNMSNESNHKIIITGGILETQCSKLLSDFFKSRR